MHQSWQAQGVCFVGIGKAGQANLGHLDYENEMGQLGQLLSVPLSHLSLSSYANSESGELRHTSLYTILYTE